MKLKFKQSIFWVVDWFFNTSITQGVSGLIYGSLFGLLFVLGLLGLKLDLIEGYFETIVTASILIFSLYYADKKLSNVGGIFYIPAFFIFLQYLFMIVDTSIPYYFLHMVSSTTVFGIFNVIIYKYFMRKDLIKKLKIKEEIVNEI